MKTKSNVEDAILGCLYGQATGDAMGMPSELWRQDKIQQFFGWIDSFLPGPDENIAAIGFRAGEVTDDTHQAIALMDAIIACNGVVEPKMIAQNILVWAKRINAFDKNIFGPTSKQSLLAIQAGIPIDEIVSNGVTNGAAMRIAPVGCVASTTNRKQFIKKVEAACIPTHKSDIAIAGAAVIAWAISRAIENTLWSQIKKELPILADEVQSQYASTFSPSLGRRISLAFEKASELQGHSPKAALKELYDFVGAGMDTIESIPCALAIVDLTNGDPVMCAKYCANLGGDTDTIGAMAGAISGAISGIHAFPKEWIALINNSNNIDFHSYAKILSTLRH
ncbi:ADP-ribosylglycohydrolase family protein [Providencia sneebia]|uniref:ADP-ribosylation/crystallin J1 n=1 Tax=Providencia sneebia DSM 19967 TaxID=1141660 RepID=K8WL65_9GAMM|nr:ADP-ribosylglycohydrolase family protein [Providencia sneebia]EKT61353.1 ADP-ribosylation/crystallin J1 [Providencia sneebia DSM 19967]